MRLAKKILYTLGVNVILVVWCAAILALGSAWNRDGTIDPGAVVITVISVGIAWHYITETIW